MSATAQVWAALGAEARAHGFPGVESYCAAYAAGFRPAAGAAGAEQAEAFYRAAEAAGLPLEVFAVRSASASGGDTKADTEADTGTLAEGAGGPGEEPWLGDEEHRGLRPVSESRSLTVAADSRPAPVPTVRPEVTLAQTAATVAVVEIHDADASVDDGPSDHGPGDAGPTGDDHAFGTGSPDHDPAVAGPAFGEGHPFTPAEIDPHGQVFGVTDPEGPPDLRPDSSPVPDAGLDGSGHDLVAPDHDVPPVGADPAHDLLDHHADAAHEPEPAPESEPAHHDVPVDHGGESFG